MPLAERTSEQVVPVLTKWNASQLSTMPAWVGVGVVIPLPGFVEVGVEVILDEVVSVVSVVGDVLDDVDDDVDVDDVEDVVGAPPVGRLVSISTQYE